MGVTEDGPQLVRLQAALYLKGAKVIQTFLPVSCFNMSAKILDRSRLGKQRIEARTILNQIRNGGGWRNHPAVKMWVGFEEALELYGDFIIQEWCRRGYKNKMPLLRCFHNIESIKMPQWIGDERFHASHRSNLLRKMPEYYKKFNWKEAQDMPYVWPV